MGQYHFRLPDVGEGVAEAEIVVWHVAVGDAIKEDQSLVDVMTDKATVDMTSPVDGVVTAIHGAVGDMMPVGSVLVELEVEGEGEQAEAVSAPAEEKVEAVAQPQPEAVDAQAEAEPTPKKDKKRAPLAAPATRARAKEAGVPLTEIAGSGPKGRILRQDLEAHIASLGGGGSASSLVRRTGVQEEKVIGLRRKIAERMQEAKRRIPHIAYVEEVDVTELEALRQDMNAHRKNGEPKLTLLPFLVRALVKVLPDFPHINARYDDDAGVLSKYEGVHVGIATQTPGGLMVPVIRHAEARALNDVASELGRVSAAARDGSASREELSGSTITITSLGPLGGVATTPVINHPEVAIIGPNKIMEKPVVQGSFISVRKVMNISSSFDHRIVDGYDAALFIQALKRLLEHPALIFMD
ncbi:MAG: 2-oxo acid dehydrogenase subunit E2 [Sphingobium sp.]|nr:2-oxo acid dehydrogenase subunit E2 [Sphingobium sp.]